MKDYVCTDVFKLVLRLDDSMDRQYVEDKLNTTFGHDVFEVLYEEEYLHIFNHDNDTEDFLFLDNYLLLNINNGEFKVVEGLDRYKEVL